MTNEDLSAGFASFAGFYEEKFPKIQILTIEDLLNGAKVKYPSYASSEGDHV
jgi:hypothetical protein